MTFHPCITDATGALHLANQGAACQRPFSHVTNFYLIQPISEPLASGHFPTYPISNSSSQSGSCLLADILPRDQFISDLANQGATCQPPFSHVTNFYLIQPIREPLASSHFSHVTNVNLIQPIREPLASSHYSHMTNVNLIQLIRDWLATILQILLKNGATLYRQMLYKARHCPR